RLDGPLAAHSLLVNGQRADGRTVDLTRDARFDSADPHVAVSPTPAGSPQNDSRALLRWIDAKVLLDMVCQATGEGEKFSGVPAGARAIQLWDSKVPHYFLKLF